MRFFRPFILFVITLLLSAGQLIAAAPGRLGGSASLGYAEYHAETEGVNDVDASHFTQQYSLVYEKAGSFLKGRAGGYKVALGAEFNALSSEINEQQINLDAFKFLYRGELTFAPGGLPVRLHAFSRDMRRSVFLLDDDEALFGAGDSTVIEAGRRVLDPDIASDLSNGQHIETGVTLLLGIRNGNYQGRYRDILSQFPRLLLDYRERYSRDMHSRTPEHFRSRDLAFVSLNKKDNWFHYRFHDYVNYNDPDDHFTEKTIMLGTVDHSLQRQWINLTNWIRISADGQFMVTDRPSSSASNQLRRENLEQYGLNFFATARRTNYSGASYSNMLRSVEEDGDSRHWLEVPVFASGEVDRNTSWRFRFIGSRDVEQVTSTLRDEEILFASSELEAFRQQRYILKPSVEVEAKSGNQGSGEGGRATFEIFSNKKHRPLADVFGSYSIAYFNGEAIQGVPIDYWEQEIKASIERQIDPRLRVGASEDVVYGRGTATGRFTEHVRIHATRGFQFAEEQDVLMTDGRLYNNRINFFLEHNTGRLTNRVSLGYEIVSNSGDADQQASLQHRLTYEKRKIRLGMQNHLIYGGSFGGRRLYGRFTKTEVPAASDAEGSFRHHTAFAYLPSKALEHRAEFEYNWFSDEAGNNHNLYASQILEYSLFTSNGVVRRLAKFREQLEYEYFTYSTLDNYSGLRLKIGGQYNPTRVTTLGADFHYIYIMPKNVNQMAIFLNAGLMFSKLRVSLDYSYGDRSAGEDIRASKEHRWEAKVTKTF